MFCDFFMNFVVIMSQIFQYFSIFTVLFYKTDIRLN